MKSLLTPVVFLLLCLFPLLSFAQDVEEEDKKSNKKSTRTDTKTTTKTNRTRVVIIEQDELDDLKEEIKIDLKELKKELKNAFKQLEDVDWDEVDQEIEIAMDEARQGLEEANHELSHIRIEIDEDLHEELEDLKEELQEIHVNNGSPRIRIMAQNSRPYKANRSVERNFSELNVEANPSLSDKMKKETTTLFDESVQNSVKIIPQTKEGKFMLNFSLSDSKADKKTTYIEVYDSEGNAMYFESLVDFSGTYQGEIDLAVNGADTYTLVVRQGTNYLSRKINLK
jgi:predicted  nucleic acid-binding Zn-ribbon protein